MYKQEVPYPRSSRGTRLVGISFFAIFFAFALPAWSGPMAPFTDHIGEDHSRENHRGEFLRGINLSMADVNRTEFREADLIGAIFNSANADRAGFRDADLTNAQFVATILDDANLRDAIFVGADLSGASLVDVNARDTDFSSALLDHVVFGRSTLRDANLRGASLLGADLSQVRNAGSADFTGAYYDAFTQLAPGMSTAGMTFVPEPSSALLLALGLLGLESYGRRSSRSLQTARAQRLSRSTSL